VRTDSLRVAPIRRLTWTEPQSRLKHKEGADRNKQQRLRVSDSRTRLMRARFWGTDGNGTRA
jgi:hypothetical protein